MAYFRDRTAAGDHLAGLLADTIGPDWLILALPRGGVPVAARIARRSVAQLDILVVLRVGAPAYPEVALAAVTGTGPEDVVVNEDVRDGLGLTRAAVARLTREAARDIAARRRRLSGSERAPDMGGRRVLLVDDGAATGTTIAAAAEAVLRHDPQQLALALPVALRHALDRLPGGVSPVVCPYPDAPLPAVSLAYDLFPQVSDAEVADLLAWSARERTG
ncbi:phosphoribosyltransferase [Rhodobacterales bacterium HKCCE3408]|nr:phosphoribosyltransferase [Rhodobacterales bacterium HKCCE3408]